MQFLYDFVWNQNFGRGLLFVGALALTSLVGLRWQENPSTGSKQSAGKIAA